jgi:hypothetical protein
MSLRIVEVKQVSRHAFGMHPLIFLMLAQIDIADDPWTDRFTHHSSHFFLFVGI